MYFAFDYFSHTAGVRGLHFNLIGLFCFVDSLHLWKKRIYEWAKTEMMNLKVHIQA